VQNTNFLIVDDSDTIIRIIKKVIETRLGSNKIYEAHNGEEAINILKSNQIDMIVSDWEMPKCSGDEFLYEVRNNKEWEKIPFIMMSSHSGKDFIASAIQLGADYYLIKPFSSDELEETIRKSWNYTSKRVAQRYASIPQYNLVIKIDNKTFPAEIINISRSGILIKLNYTDNLRLFGTYELLLEIEEKDIQNSCVISPLFGKSVRLESDQSFQNSSLKCLMALYFEPALMNKKVEENLLKFLDMLKSFTPDIIPA
jgi:two-component system, chemotaxis family, chemotaxis protein CheY